MQVLWTLDLRDTPGDGLRPDSTVTNIAFLQELEALCVTATQGELLLVHSNKDVEEVFPSASFHVTPRRQSHYCQRSSSDLWSADWPSRRRHCLQCLESG